MYEKEEPVWQTGRNGGTLRPPFQAVQLHSEAMLASLECGAQALGCFCEPGEGKKLPNVAKGALAP